MIANGSISESSKRIARNTVLLYFRMLLMLGIGLFASRIVLKSLGVEDYGTYDAVSGVVTMFNLVCATLTTAISRYITVALGKGDPERLRRVFATSLLIQLGLCALLLVLTETAGLAYLHGWMHIPEGRMGAADVVLQCSMLLLMVQLLAVPYNAVITAHEHMGAYAYISILEAVLKLAVALLLFYSGGDRLILYAVLMLGVGVLVRGAFAGYAKRHFPETRGPKKLFDKGLLKEMSAFAGWNFLGSGSYMVNTQGVNQLVNLFFGVRLNAARGIAGQVERVLRQAATNIALAMNPQMTKSYAAGDRTYSFEIARKGSKYYFLVLFTLTLPFLFESETILQLWLGHVPESAALFTSLGLLCFIMDFTPNPLITLELANGKVRRYYIWTSALAVLVFPLTLLLFYFGAKPWVPYGLFLGIYALKWALMLQIVHRDTGFPVGAYLRQAVLPMLLTSIPSAFVTAAAWQLLHPADSWIRLVGVCAAALLSMGATAWAFGLTPGERAFVKQKIFRSR